MTTLQALFVGSDATGHSTLWLTDGTSAGTREVSAAATLSGIVDQTDITVLGSKALFRGQDASNHVNLWVTDGTAAGTSELAVAGANPSGLLFTGTPDFTVLGSKVLFEGNGPGLDLWVTDGTVAGTSKLTAAGLAPSDLTVLGNNTDLRKFLDTSVSYLRPR
jgi:ELWxxDGT repeat protein